MSSNGDWRVIVGFQARLDLFQFPWRDDIERAGVLTGRWETAGIRRHDDGRTLFVRRCFPADRNGTSESVEVAFDAVTPMETIEVSKWGGRPRGRFAENDAGIACGDIHSHVGFDVTGDYHRQLSDADISRGAALALAPSTIPRPWLSVVASAGEAWLEGMPHEDWGAPNLDFFLVFSDSRVVKPTVILQSETEWTVEEQQRVAQCLLAQPRATTPVAADGPWGSSCPPRRSNERLR